MSITTRVYVVTNKTTGDKTLLEETHPSKALRAVTSEDYDVEAAPSSLVVDLIQKGARVIRPAQLEFPEVSAA